MHNGKTVSIVFPSYNEKENIKNAIEEFLAHPAVDEVIAVDNNSTDGSDADIKSTRAVYVKEMRQGYGAALMRGMKEATKDLIVTVEPDGTFRASDLDKLLAYSADSEAVFGTRTFRPFVGPEANMDWFLRIGNKAVAKLLEILFDGPPLSDVGCTYKLFQRGAYERIAPSLTVEGSHFSPELMIRTIEHRVRLLEIPVNYHERIGTSKVTGRRSRAITLGFEMIFFIIWQWVLAPWKRTARRKA